MLLRPVFPVLFPRPLNGFEVVCGANVKDPDGGAGAKFTVEGFEGGKEALMLKLKAGVLVLLPESVENGLFSPICPKRFGAVPLENEGEPAVESPP
jgi:hypothetical protein